MPLLVQQWAGEGALGGFLPQHRILTRRQQLAPFRIGVGDLELLTGRGGRWRDTTIER